MSANPGAGRRRLRLRSPWSVTVAIGLAAIGFVGAAQWNSSIGRQQFLSSAQQALSDQVVALEQEQADLRQQVGDAEDQVQQFQDAATTSSTALAALNRQLATARLSSGLTAVVGPGCIIEIADSVRPVPPGENAAGYIVLVDDLRDLVNALWASGAEAIAVNDERLVASSSIYGVGASVLVNTAFLSPPFRIVAIGPAGLLDRFLENPAYLGRVARRIDAFGLEFATQSASELTLPAFIGNTRMRWAVPTAAPTAEAP